MLKLPDLNNHSFRSAWTLNGFQHEFDKPSFDINTGLSRERRHEDRRTPSGRICDWLTVRRSAAGEAGQLQRHVRRQA